MNIDNGLKTLISHHVKYTVDRNPTIEKIAEAMPQYAEELLESLRAAEAGEVELTCVDFTFQITTKFL